MTKEDIYEIRKIYKVNYNVQVVMYEEVNEQIQVADLDFYLIFLFIQIIY